MFRTFLLSGLAALSLLAVAPRSDAFIALPGHLGRHNRQSFQVQYRQLEWRESRFYDQAEARRFEQFQEWRGFQVHMHRQGGLWIVHYRMAGWQNFRSVNSPSEAYSLERMLESRGFDARVVRF